MTTIVEMFGAPARMPSAELARLAVEQHCPYADRKCVKTRKSQPEVAIGTCAVEHGRNKEVYVICPYRLLQHNQVFLDCIHLLTSHEPGNSLYIVPEVVIPGGNVDYFLVSAKDGKVCDFVGIELQTIDTTGTIWPNRQKLLAIRGAGDDYAEDKGKHSFGMNWKMSAKTILIQMHHKADTFEHLRKHLVLVVQSPFYAHMQSTFAFDHIGAAKLGDTVHFHRYDALEASGRLRLSLAGRTSTDAAGVAKSLGLQAKPQVELREIVQVLEEKLTDANRFIIGSAAGE